MNEYLKKVEPNDTIINANRNANSCQSPVSGFCFHSFTFSVRCRGVSVVSVSVPLTREGFIDCFVDFYWMDLLGLLENLMHVHGSHSPLIAAVGVAVELSVACYFHVITLPPPLLVLFSNKMLSLRLFNQQFRIIRVLLPAIRPQMFSNNTRTAVTFVLHLWLRLSGP